VYYLTGRICCCLDEDKHIKSLYRGILVISQCALVLVPSPWIAFFAGMEGVAFCSSSMATKSQSSGSLLERAARSGAPHFPIKDCAKGEENNRVLLEPKKHQIKKNKEYTASHSESYHKRI